MTDPDKTINAPEEIDTSRKFLILADDQATLFRQAIESLPHAVLIVDREGAILFANAQGEKLFGYVRGELAGQPVAVLLPGRFRAKHREYTEAFFADPQPKALGQGRDLHGVRKDGTEFPAEVGLSPLETKSGLLVLCAVVDISQRKRLETELTDRNGDLETLLYVTSHDLREPLRSVIGFCHLVQDRYGGQLDAKGQDFLRRAVRAAERLDRLLEDVLTLSRAQRLIDPREEVAAGDIVADALKQLSERIRETNAGLHVARDLPRFYADRRWAIQAVYNLLSNALKFTRPDQPPDIEIAAFEPDEQHAGAVGLVVRDRGPGVPAHLAERIFGLFERAVGQEIDGTGAGLAIVRQVAARHGGAVWVQPREGGGAEFIITFGRGGQHD